MISVSSLVDKKYHSWNSKLRHQKAVIKLEALYISETKMSTIKGVIEKIAKKEKLSEKFLV